MFFYEQECVNEEGDNCELKEAVDVERDVEHAGGAQYGNSFFEYEHDECGEDIVPRGEVRVFGVVFEEFCEQCENNGNHGEIINRCRDGECFGNAHSAHPLLRWIWVMSAMMSRNRMRLTRT